MRASLSRHYGIVFVGAVWLVFAINFNYGYLWGGDAQVPFTFLRRLFGADVDAVGYQFGLAFFEAPFYALGKGFEAAGVETIGSHPAPEAVVALGAIVYVGVTAALAYLLVRALGIGRPALAAGLALFGTPLFYYGTFGPGNTHAVDSLLATSLAGVVFLGFRRDWPSWLAGAAGAIVALAATVRWFQAALGGAVFLALIAYRRYRAAAILALAGAAVLAVLLSVPVVLGVAVFGGGYEASILSWSPESPFNMLFTLKRGLFVWTPLTALSVIGYVLLLRRRPDRQPFLLTLGLMAFALVCAQAAVPFWYAGWSFSQRYFTSLFPFFVVGIAGLIEWRPRLVTAAAAVSIVWSLFLCLTMVTLPFDDRGGADELVSLARTQSPGSYAYGVYRISHLRFLLPYEPFDEG